MTTNNNQFFITFPKAVKLYSKHKEELKNRGGYYYAYRINMLMDILENFEQVSIGETLEEMDAEMKKLNGEAENIINDIRKNIEENIFECPPPTKWEKRWGAKSSSQPDIFTGFES